MATTLNIRVNGPLADFIADNIGNDGLYDNASEHVRHLIRQDKERVGAARFATLKAELQRAFFTRIKRQRGVAARSLRALTP